MTCKRHTYRFLRADLSEEPGYSYGAKKFKRVDVFFCQHCLDEKKKEQETVSSNTPAWYSK